MQVEASRSRSGWLADPLAQPAPSRPGAGAPRPPGTGRAACTRTSRAARCVRRDAPGDRRTARRACRRARGAISAIAQATPAPQSWPTTCGRLDAERVEHRGQVARRSCRRGTRSTSAGLPDVAEAAQVGCNDPETRVASASGSDDATSGRESGKPWSRRTAVPSPSSSTASSTPSPVIRRMIGQPTGCVGSSTACIETVRPHRHKSACEGHRDARTGRRANGRRFRRRHAARRQPLHRRDRGLRQRPRDAARFPGGDPRAGRHGRGRLRVPDPLRVARHPHARRRAGRAGGDEPGRAEGEPRADAARRDDPRQRGRVHRARGAEGGLRGVPARGRDARRLHRQADPDELADLARRSRTSTASPRATPRRPRTCSRSACSRGSTTARPRSRRSGSAPSSAGR